MLFKKNLRNDDFYFVESRALAVESSDELFVFCARPGQTNYDHTIAHVLQPINTCSNWHGAYQHVNLAPFERLQAALVFSSKQTNLEACFFNGPPQRPNQPGKIMSVDKRASLQRSEYCLDFCIQQDSLQIKDRPLLQTAQALKIFVPRNFFEIYFNCLRVARAIANAVENEFFVDRAGVGD